MSPRYDVPNAAPPPLRLVQQFVNTVDHEHGREWLGTETELATWLAEAGAGTTNPTPADVARAHELRGALQDLLAANNGRPLKPDAVATINRMASAAQIAASLDQRGDLQFDVHGRDVDAALGRIIAIVFGALAGDAWSRLKTCRNCTWAFYDYSRNRSAKWCSMQICGNRLKSRRYRRREVTGR